MYKSSIALNNKTLATVMVGRHEMIKQDYENKVAYEDYKPSYVIYVPHNVIID